MRLFILFLVPLLISSCDSLDSSKQQEEETTALYNSQAVPVEEEARAEFPEIFAVDDVQELKQFMNFNNEVHAERVSVGYQLSEKHSAFIRMQELATSDDLEALTADSSAVVRTYAYMALYASQGRFSAIQSDRILQDEADIVWLRSDVEMWQKVRDFVLGNSLEKLPLEKWHACMPLNQEEGQGR